MKVVSILMVSVGVYSAYKGEASEKYYTVLWLLGIVLYVVGMSIGMISK